MFVYDITMNELALLGGTPVRQKPFPPWPVATEKEKRYLMKVIESDGWGVFRGKLTFELGEKFAQYHGAKYGISCTNATAALKIQLQSLGISRGDEVITTGFTFIATITAILEVGAIPIFVDINTDDYCIDTKKIREKITPKTKAILAVHLYNALCNLNELAEIARQNNLFLIEDAAQVPGSFYENQGVGTFGVSGSFSFQESKVITAGEGGMIITSSEEMCELAHSYINCGRTREGDRVPRQVMGNNYRMTDFQAAVLLGQLEVLEERTDKREQSVAYLNSHLETIPGISIMRRSPKVTKQACYSYIFKINPEVLKIDREVFIQALEAEGIPTRKLYVPTYKDPLFHLNVQDTPEAWDYYSRHPIQEKDYPNAERAALEGIAIWHPMLLGKESDLEDLIHAVEKIVSNAGALRNKV